MDEDAQKVFHYGTEAPGLYNHGRDTWNKVTHEQYSVATRELLGSWIQEKGGTLNGSHAREFLSWIASGKCDDPKFLAKHAAAFATVFKWRDGFNQSIVIAHRAAELNPKLTGPELKAIAQHFVNGPPTQPLSRAAAKTAAAIVKGGKAALRATAKRVLPGLMFLSAAMAAKRGWAGDGHTGDGAWGALNETTRDLISADLAESIIFPKVLDTVDGQINLVAPGLNEPSRRRYLRRGGRLIDLETGRIVN
jgi:hypothetical protein